MMPILQLKKLIVRIDDIVDAIGPGLDEVVSLRRHTQKQILDAGYLDDLNGTL